MPPLPKEIIDAVNTFWESANGSAAFSEAKRKIAKYALEHGVDMFKVMDKARMAKNIGEVVKDASLAGRAVETGEALSTTLGAGEAAAVPAEVVGDVALGEMAGGAAAMSAGAVAFAVIAFVAIVALVAYSAYRWKQLEQQGQAQDRQRRLDKGLRSVIWKPPTFQPGRLG